MTSAQTLLYTSASDVTLARVHSLLQQVGPESPTVEYKQKLADTVARGVAALANTYGGIMLIGVTDDRKIVGVKESVIASVAEHCAAKIEPSYVPEIIPVPVDDVSGLVVLVLRVIPGHYIRPLLVGGIAYVRHQNTTHPADWQRLADLFSHGAAAQQDGTPWDIVRPSLPMTPDRSGTDKTIDLVMRSGLNLPLSREAKWRPLSEQNVSDFAQALDRSAFSQVLARIAISPEGDVVHYHRSGFNRARTVRLEWSATPAGWPSSEPMPVKAFATLEVPGDYGDASTHLTVHIDAHIHMSVAREVFATSMLPPYWRMSIPQLRDVIDSLMATLTSHDLRAPIAALAGVDADALPQPRVLHLVTARPITEVIALDGLRLIPEAGDSHGAHLLSDPIFDLAEPADRAAQVRNWLIQTGLDAGLLGMEQLLDRLAATA